MSDCLFCKIAAGTIPAKKLHEDDDVVAFADIAPQAPTHVLVIPRRHLGSLADAGEADQALLGRLLLVARQLATALPGGHRVVVNSGADGGQSVHHLHLHLLGGRQLGWPPG